MPLDLAPMLSLLEARFGLDALWLFGSEARGTARAESDVDMAALFRRHPSAAELLDAKSSCAVSLGRDVDLVDLAKASPILAMQVVRTGMLVHEGDAHRRNVFLASLPSRYEDAVRLRDAAFVYAKERLSGAG